MRSNASGGAPRRALLVVMLGVSGCLQPGRPVQVPPPPPAPSMLPRLHLYFSELLPEDDHPQYDMIALHRPPDVEQRRLPYARQVAPQAKAVMYRELFFVSAAPDTGEGVTAARYDWVNQHHPEWFLQHADGKRVNIPDYPEYWAVDPANLEWQVYWIENTLQDVIRGGWDGVFIDDVLPTVRAHELSKYPPIKGYPDDATLQRAVSQFLQRIYPAFHAKGKLVILNITGSYQHPGLLEQWLDVSDGYMEEHFAGEAWTWGRDVGQRQMEAMREAARRGKWMLCMTYGPWKDRERLAQSMAAYLVGSHPGITWAYRPDDADLGGRLQYPEWVRRLGRPISEPIQLNGLWRREFESGAVVVNPTWEFIEHEWHGQRARVAPRGFHVWIPPAG